MRELIQLVGVLVVGREAMCLDTDCGMRPEEGATSSSIVSKASPKNSFFSVSAPLYADYPTCG